MKKTLPVLAFAFLLSSCGKDHSPFLDSSLAPVKATGSSLGGGATPTYEGQVKALFEAKCKACHGSGPAKNWLDYGQAFEARDRIYDRVVVKKNMPVGGALSAAELDLITRWVQGGAPKDAPGQKPEPKPEPKPDPKPEPKPDNPIDPASLTWEKDILPIVENRCSMCHNEDSAKNPEPSMPNWKLYESVVAKKEAILQRVIQQKGTPTQMPPEGIEIEQRERDIIEAWINAGTKKGN